jgi:branched-chain amino acid transport system substrate-binding protein
VRLFSAICGSKVALAICEASRDDSVVILDAISTVPKLSQYGGKKYFRICASEAHAGRNNVDWAVEEGAKSFLIVYVEDEWGTSYRDALQEVLASKGQSVSVLPVDLKSRDLRVEAQKAAEKKADAIFLVLYANLAMPFIQQAKVYGLSGKVYGGDNLSSTDFSVAGADATEGVRISLPAEPNSPAFSSFQKDYHDRFAEDPDVFAIKSYDALMLLAHAVDTAGDDPVAVAEYLRTMKPYEGISGPISFDAHGDLAQQKYQRLVYVAGKLKPWHK